MLIPAAAADTVPRLKPRTERLPHRAAALRAVIQRFDLEGVRVREASL